MRCYIVYSQISNAARENLFAEAVKSYGTWAKIGSNLWAVGTDRTAVQVRDHLKPYAEPADTVFVIRSGAEAAWDNVQCNAEWLKKFLPMV